MFAANDILAHNVVDGIYSTKTHINSTWFKIESSSKTCVKRSKSELAMKNCFVKNNCQILDLNDETGYLKWLPISFYVVEFSNNLGSDSLYLRYSYFHRVKKLSVHFFKQLVYVK